MLCATKFRIPAFRSSYSLLKSRAVVSTSGISKIKKSFSKNKVNYYSSSSPSESPKQHLSMENFTAYCKRKGWIFQTADIYGGLAGTFDYGPLGVLLKRNIRELWWSDFILKRKDCLGIETPVIMNPEGWTSKTFSASLEQN